MSHIEKPNDINNKILDINLKIQDPKGVNELAATPVLIAVKDTALEPPTQS